MTSVLCVAASPPREFISQVDLTFKIYIVAYLYICNLIFFTKNKEHQNIIHVAETGHINPGQHIGVYDPQQQQQQELGQFPSGPRSISLQVYPTQPDPNPNSLAWSAPKIKLYKQDLASSSRPNPPPSRRASKGLLDVTNVNINNSEIDKVLHIKSKVA